MFRTRLCLAAALLAVGMHAASAQTTAPATPAPAASTAKPSRVKLTMEKLRAMKAHWQANRPKLKACRAEVRRKGLIGDDRWFYIADCMEKT